MKLSRQWTIVLIGISGTIVVGCKDPRTSSSPVVSGVSTGSVINPIPDAPDPNTNPAPGYTSSDLFVYVSSAPKSDKNPYPKSVVDDLHVWNDWTQPCRIQAGSGATDLLCYYEIEEGDLYTAGRYYYDAQPGTQKSDDRLYMTYNIPSSFGCAYVAFRPFFYWQFEPGVGPTSVLENVPDSGAATFSDPASSGTNATVDSATGKCTRDYTNQGGPNCCIGKYTLTINTSNGSSSSQMDWGGDWSQCLSGPGANKTFWPYRLNPTNPNSDLSNFPGYEVLDSSLMGGKDFSQVFPFGGGWSVGALTNAYAGNYFDVTTAPSDYLNSANWPQAIRGPGGGVFPMVSPWYEAICYDHSWDVRQRIRIMIRPWSSDSEFVSAKAGGAGSWMLSTPEGVPFDDNQVLDYPGWTDASGTYAIPDFLTAYPGFYN